MPEKTKKILLLLVLTTFAIVAGQLIFGGSALDEYKKTANTQLEPAAEQVLNQALQCIEKDDMKALFGLMFSSDYGVFRAKYEQGLFAVKDFMPVQITGKVRKVTKSTSNNVLVEVFSIKRNSNYYVSLVEYKGSWKVAGISSFKLPE